MSSANVVQRVINLSLTLVGHLKGGLSQVVAVFSMFFSEMSGRPLPMPRDEPHTRRLHAQGRL